MTACVYVRVRVGVGVYAQYATHTYVLERLNGKGLAYVHLTEPRVQGARRPAVCMKTSLKAVVFCFVVTVAPH